MKRFFVTVKNSLKDHIPVVVSAGLFLTGCFVPRLFSLPPVAEAIWMALSAVFLLSDVIGEAVEEIHDKSMGENTLLVIAVAAAFVIGEWVEGAAVLLLFSIGEWIEDVATVRSRKAISAIAAVTPETALKVLGNNHLSEIPAEEIRPGDKIRILPHSRIPADCRIVKGESAVNTAAITGESIPVAVAPESELLSGTINGDGELTAVVLRKSGESAAARILHLVEEASERKGESEKFITRFARVYTPTVAGMALLLAVAVPLLFGGWMMWIYRALVFLVASCPCALVISIPLGFYAGIAAAAQKGILIKGGCFAETLAKVNAVGFDKTGTLTDDVLVVTEVHTDGTVPQKRALALAGTLEQYSQHPIACAIVKEAGAIRSLPMKDREERPGIGVTAEIKGKAVACGGQRLLEELKINRGSFPECEAYLVVDQEVVAAFSVTARLREDAAGAVEALRRLSVRRIALLTGDRRSASEPIAKAVGISEIHAELLPEEKLQQIRDWKSEGRITAFVGDGINDAPVLAEADVGVAMGFGSEAAIETADVVLVEGNLKRLPTAIALSRRIVRTVNTNIVFALTVKLAVLVLAVVGFAPIWLGVFADMGVTLLCILNTLRLLISSH